MEEKISKYKGLWPVMLTPFQQNGRVDFRVLDELTDFYIENGATGLFANCLSSEMYELDEEERLAIIKSVIKRVNGSLPVAATGTFAGSFGSQADFIKKVSDTGASVVVLVTSQLTEKNHNEIILEDNLLNISGLTPGISLGLYECPLPYKRIISPELVNKLAQTGRFTYLKDTTCNSDMVLEKINAVMGTPLSIFNANTPTSLETLKAGADGISPISANFYPELYSWLVNNYQDKNKSGYVEYLNDQLTMMDAITRINYPMSAKVFLLKRGIHIEPVIRTSGSPVNFEEGIILDKLFKKYMELKNEIGKI